MSSRRDPYPFPRLQNDNDFVKNDPNSSGDSSGLNISGDKEILSLSPGEPTPWERLNSNKTLSSQRHEIYYYDPKAPNDNLDFVLKCQYDHHSGFMCSKAEALLQPETAGVEHGRVLKNRPVVPEPVTLETKELMDYTEARKTTIDSAKGLSIKGHHSEATNRGYSRKKDGGFFCS